MAAATEPQAPPGRTLPVIDNLEEDGAATAPAPVEKISLPEDGEAKISILLWASDLVMQERVTHLAYKDEVNQKQISGLSHTTRDVDKATNERLAVLRRLYGPIAGMGGPTRTLPSRAWIITGLLLFLGVSTAGYYIAATPNAYLGLQAWWGAWGGWLEALIIAVALFALFIQLRRSRRKKA